MMTGQPEHLWKVWNIYTYFAVSPGVSIDLLGHMPPLFGGICPKREKRWTVQRGKGSGMCHCPSIHSLSLPPLALLQPQLNPSPPKPLLLLSDTQKVFAASPTAGWKCAVLFASLRPFMMIRSLARREIELGCKLCIWGRKYKLQNYMQMKKR